MLRELTAETPTANMLDKVENLATFSWLLTEKGAGELKTIAASVVKLASDESKSKMPAIRTVTEAPMT